MPKKKKDINEVLEDLQDVNKVELPKQASLPDQSEDLGDQVKKTHVPTPEKLPKGFGEDPVTDAGKKLKEKKYKQAADAKKRGIDKIEVDLDNYLTFVDGVTSDPSKDFDKLIERYQDLRTAGCNIARLDTAASGLVAEAGEFMEIVKKIKFQGKPWNEDNKEHLMLELGDILWYAAQACMALNIRMDEVFIRNTLKLAMRYEGKEFTVEKSENRKKGDR